MTLTVVMNLKTARKIARLTQTELAERASVKQETISQLENGRIKQVSYETVARLAHALNVTVEELFPLELLESA